MTIKHYAITALATLGSILPSMAADGTTAYNFLNVTSSTRVYGLGGVNVSLIDDDINLIDQNPALLGTEMDKQLGVSYMNYIGDSNFAGVRYGLSRGESGAWAFGARYFGYGNLKGADEMGNLTGSFSAKDMAFTATYSHDITDRLRGGIAVSALYSAYDIYSAFAMATDLGINYYAPEDGWSASAVVANLGGQLKRFNERYDRLPLDLRLGVTRQLADAPLSLSVTAWNLTRWSLPYYEVGDGTDRDELKRQDSFGSNLFRHLVLGAEWTPNQTFTLGIGYNYKNRTDMSTYTRSMLSGFSVAAGLKVGKFNIGAALSTPHTGSTVMMLNLTTRLATFE